MPAASAIRGKIVVSRARTCGEENRRVSDITLHIGPKKS